MIATSDIERTWHARPALTLLLVALLGGCSTPSLLITFSCEDLPSCHLYVDLCDHDESDPCADCQRYEVVVDNEARAAFFLDSDAPLELLAELTPRTSDRYVLIKPQGDEGPLELAIVVGEDGAAPKGPCANGLCSTGDCTP